MIYQLANEDVTKYSEVARNNDIDDFVLWYSFKNRQNEIDKYFMNKNNKDYSENDLTNHNVVKKSMTAKEISDYYQQKANARI